MGMREEEMGRGREGEEMSGERRPGEGRARVKKKEKSKRGRCSKIRTRCPSIGQWDATEPGDQSAAPSLGYLLIGT